jgi:hypothetical protein
MDASGDETRSPWANAGNRANRRGHAVTYLWWAIDSGMIRIGRWFKRARREASLFHDWDTELTEAEAERENWEPGELWAFGRPSLDYFA